MRFIGSLKDNFVHRRKALTNIFKQVSRAVVIGSVVLATAACSVGKSWSDLLAQGRLELKNGDYAAAEKSLQAASDAAQKKFGQNAGQTATCMTDLAELYTAQQEYRKASKVFKDLIPIYQKIEPGSADESRIVAEYNDVKKKIKKYQLEPDEVPSSEVKAGAKTDAAETKGGTVAKSGDKPAASK